MTFFNRKAHAAATKFTFDNSHVHMEELKHELGSRELCGDSQCGGEAATQKSKDELCQVTRGWDKMGQGMTQLEGKV